MKRCNNFWLGLAMAMTLATALAFAQIPNPGFENWSGGNPVDWVTSNTPPTFTNVTQATPSHSGSFALQGNVAQVFTVTIPATIISGPDGQGYPNTTRPAALHGWYKFTPVGGDLFYVLIAFKKNGTAMGGGAFQTGAAQSSYREFIANIFYNTGDNPDTAVITGQIANGTGSVHFGTTFVLDDLAYGPAGADVREDAAGIPQTFSLHQNYPNPFNPSTTIRYEIPQAAHVSLKVFNMVGEEVATLVDGERTAGVYNAEWNAADRASGTYFYRLTAGNFSSVRKLMLVK